MNNADRDSSARPRILMVTGRADASGGPEHVFQLTRGLLDDCEVFIAAPRDVPYWERFSQLVGSGRMVELPHRSFSLRALRAMNRLVRRERIDLLHSHGRSGGIFARVSSLATGRPSVHTPHLPHAFDSAKGFACWGMDWALSLRSRHMIAVSPSEERSIRRNFARRSGLSTIPNGVAVPDSVVTCDNLRSRPLRIVHVTRFVPQKNTELVLDILEALGRRGARDQFHVDVLGDGPGRAALTAAARERGVSGNLTFHGTCPSIAPHVSRAFCLLSTSRSEGLPLAVLEAMATGLPVVATDVAGNRDVVSRRVGRLFPLSDPDRAASILLELAERPDEWARLSDAARAEVEDRFSIGRMTAGTLAVYRSVLERVGSGVESTRVSGTREESLRMPGTLS